MAASVSQIHRNTVRSFQGFKIMAYDGKNNLGFYLSLSPFSFDCSTPTKDIVFLPKTQQPHFAICPIIGRRITRVFSI